MSLKPCGLALAFLVLTAAAAEAQSSWDRYQLRSLAEITELQREALNDTRETLPPGVPGILFSGLDFASRVKVTYTGKSREISPGRKQIIADWIRTRRLKPAVADIYEREFSFVEDGVEHWIPVQKIIVWDEIPRGSTVELFVLYVAAYFEGPATDWLFVVTGI